MKDWITLEGEETYPDFGKLVKVGIIVKPGRPSEHYKFELCKYTIDGWFMFSRQTFKFVKLSRDNASKIIKYVYCDDSNPLHNLVSDVPETQETEDSSSSEEDYTSSEETPAASEEDFE